LRWPKVDRFVWLALALGGCAGPQSALEPHSPAAWEINRLWWVTLGLGTAVFVVVMVFLLAALFRRRPGRAQTTTSPSRAHPRGVQATIVTGGILMPTAVLTGLLILTLATMRTITSLAPAPAGAAGSGPGVIEIIGHQWWWEVRYPASGAATANEIHLPVGQPMTLRLTSVDVIHSFWVPELHGKLDLVPGDTNHLTLQADQPGEYRGQCAEFCGLQHANMALLVVVQPPEEFAAWLAAQAQPAAAPIEAQAAAGEQIFLQSDCVKCHTIRGTAADGRDGPDLTHLASRTTLAAGTLPNTPEHLARWVSDPQADKPGNLMPKPELNESDLQAVLAYLGGLR
jgi:cytochrome c oxidase subunit 2